MSVIFLHCNAVLSLPFPYCTLWKEVAMCCSHLRSVAPLPWEKSVYIIYWDFCMGDLFLFLHSFIHVGMESHRYLLFTLGDGPVWLSFVAKHVPGLAIGNSFSGLLCHVHMPPLFMAFSGLFLSNSLLSGTVRPSRLILCISCPSSRISHFSKEPWCLLLENGIKDQELGAGCAGCCSCVISCRSSPQTEGRMCVC